MAITFLFYTAKKSEAVETGCNNVLGGNIVPGAGCIKTLNHFLITVL